MKALPPLLLVVSAVAAVFAFWPDDGRSVKPEGRRPTFLTGSESVGVLAGRSPIAGVEVLVRQRYGAPGPRAFTDRHLSEALDWTGDGWSFLEMVVVNGSQESFPADLTELELRQADGALVPVRSLHGEPPVSERGRMISRALAPDDREPLAPGTWRRWVFAIPAAVSFEDLAGGSWLGAVLEPAQSTTDAVIRWLDRPRQDGRLLEAVLEADPPAQIGESR